MYQIIENIEEAVSLSQKVVELDSEEIYYQHTLITLLLKSQRWLAAKPYFKHFIQTAKDEFVQEIWQDIKVMLQEIVAIDQTTEALQVIDETEAGERWRPLREAVMVLSTGDKRYLIGVASEI